MGEFFPQSRSVQQYIPIANSLSLISQGKIRGGSSQYQMYTPTQNITFSNSQAAHVYSSPRNVVSSYNPMIKHLPIETERVGQINQSYYHQQTKSLNNQPLADSRKLLVPLNNSNSDSSLLYNQITPIRPNQFNQITVNGLSQSNSQQIHAGQLQKYYGAPLSAVSSQSKKKPQYFPAQSQKQQIQQVSQNLNNSNASQSSLTKLLSTPQQVTVGTYATPVRTIDEPLTLKQVQDKLEEGIKERNQAVIPSEKTKIFGEAFLEQRERDFLRRIENLELQKNLLQDQLKAKEDEVSQLSMQMSDIQAEKNQRELQLVEEIEKLNQVVEDLTQQNQQLREFAESQEGNGEQQIQQQFQQQGVQQYQTYEQQQGQFQNGYLRY